MVGGHPRPDVRQDSRLVVIAIALDPVAAHEGARPEPDRFADLSLELVDEVSSRQRPDLVLAIHWVADLERSDRAREPRLELIGDRLFDDESLGCDAALAVVLVARPARHRRRRVEVCVGENDERVRAAELEHGLLERSARRLGDRHPGLLGTG